jgi:collagen beta-1,O-galactosyltransferase
MTNKLISIILFFIFLIVFINGKKYHLFDENDLSTISSLNNQRLLIDIDIYNRPYVLPYFFYQLEQLTCPCNQCYLDLRIYHVYNTTIENETNQLLNEWVLAMKNFDQSVFTKITIHEWTAKSKDDQTNRLHDVMKRISELEITYLAMFDSMIILLEPSKLLSILISKDKPLMTPLLRSTKDMYTSTFYLNDQQSTGYYSYKQIYERKKLGCFLIDGGIKDFYFFNFQYLQIREIFLKNKFIQSIDIIARENFIPSYVCNREIFGYIPAQYLEAFYDETIIHDLYIHTLIEHQLNGPSQTYLSPIQRTSLINIPLSKEKTKFGLDEIYVINLLRRSDRRERLKSTFDILNISVRFFDAIDGKYTINQTYLENLNIRLLPNYEDPYNHRPMNYGELGCFFSHYFIWQDMIKNNYLNGILILEDDVRFDESFKRKLEKILLNNSLNWDIIYLGRKIMKSNEENYENIIEQFLIEPSYSHWTVGYLLSLRAAKILINENPLQKILPVDEYLPIMYDHHPNENWKSYFSNRILKAYAFHPSIITPTHYFGEPNYISDTENTTILGKYNQNDDLNRSKLLSVDVITTQKPIEDNISMKKEEL